MGLSAEQIGGLAEGVRRRTQAIDDELVTAIEREVVAYRDVLERAPAQRPPAELVEPLRMIGWLIYEASMGLLWDIAPAFESLAGDKGEQSRADAALVVRLADAARQLPWPEFAPRALGAIRAHALVESKRDTELGFDAAYIFHQEARTKQQSFADSHGDEPDRDQYVLDLQEVLLQLALAETGTACRTAERVLGLWVEELDKDPREAAWTDDESGQWTKRMFRQLYDGVSIGERALSVAEEIEREHGFTYEVTASRLAMPTAYRNPAIMTCRALLLVYSMCPEMEELGEDPIGADSWEKFRENLIARFDRAFEYLRRTVLRADGTDWGLLFDHLRSMVQLCLHLALLIPNHRLSRELAVDGELTLHRLDDDAVEAISAWLAADGEDGKQRGDANIIGTASKPSFIASVEACRTDGGTAADYRVWRRRWFVLDRYAGTEGRAERMTPILGGRPGH
ncbi:MAG TPA: hypothetical protein VL738_17685 [Dactylosporangium sp.]|nr:hypothetical protein [Dactylosporangium sp.]